MQVNGERMLDQLWFTWSTSGLGSMPMGFRVRAASERFYDIQGMDYRQVSRFVEYKLPQGVSASEFSPNNAPISLSLVDNGNERLLIRKEYLGLEAAGRNGNFFTHLIAGLPQDFTARDAIRLWYCPELWVESEAGKAPSDKSLEKIRYSNIRKYADHPQTNFNISPVSEPLQQLLLLILTKGLPPRILVRGHSSMIAPLIYGLTHALPVNLLPGLTFTTYESNVQESEALITGTINGAELQDITRIQIEPGKTDTPVSADMQHYVVTAVNALVTSSSIEKLTNVINEIDRRDHAMVEDLIELFNRRFRHGPLKPKQLEDTISYPADNLEDLADPAFQMDSVQLLLSQPDYWQSRGKQVFQQKIVNRLVSGGQTKSELQARESLTNYVNGMAAYLLSAIQMELSQGTLPSNRMTLLGEIAHPSLHPNAYLRMLTEFAQEPLLGRIKSDALWRFHLWLLACVKLMQPIPTWEQINPWLYIPPNWDKLEDVLRLDLPVEWEHQAIFVLLSANRDIPKTAYALLKTNEAKFKRSMQSLLIRGGQKGNQEWINAALRLFAAIIRYEEQDHSYPNRVGLLIALLNAVPNDSRVIEALFEIVPINSPYQLVTKEFDQVVAGCRPEVLVAGGASQSLMLYLQEYVLTLTPKKLNPNTINLLTQFQRTSANLPVNIANLVSYWLTINAFLANQTFDDKKLRNIEAALEALVPLLQQRGQNTWQTFIEELAPNLTTLIETEYQLQIVVNVFEGAGVVRTKWVLLNVLSAYAGAAYKEHPNLYRLFPYIIVGIREHIHSGQPKKALDTYLQTLLAQVSDNAPSEIDKAITAKVWPESIQKEWKGWRERSKPSFGDRFKNVFQQPKSQTEYQVENIQPDQQFQGFYNSRPEEQIITFPKQASPVWQSTDQQPQKQITLSSPQAYSSERALFYFTLNGTPYKYIEEHYQQLRIILIYLLPYWRKVLESHSSEDKTRALENEESTINDLLNELQKNEAKTISQHLVQYIVDNYLIIQKINQIRADIDQYIDNYINPDKHTNNQLKELKKRLGASNYQKICEIYSEEAIKNELSSLIRRYYFAIYIATTTKSSWKRWLEQERKLAPIAYPNRT